MIQSDPLFVLFYFNYLINNHLYFLSDPGDSYTHVDHFATMLKNIEHRMLNNK